MSELSKIPAVGDEFKYKNIVVRVLKADSKKTELVEIEILN